VFTEMAGMCHLTASSFITDFSGDQAKGVCSVIFEGDTKAGAHVHATAYYDDVYVRTSTGWRFTARTVVPFTQPDMGPVSEAAASGNQ
jgi:hypothetical protein